MLILDLCGYCLNQRTVKHYILKLLEFSSCDGKFNVLFSASSHGDVTEIDETFSLSSGIYVERLSTSVVYTNSFLVFSLFYLILDEPHKSQVRKYW